MTATRKPGASDDVLIILGQLLEATKATSDGLKSISLEVQNNAKNLATVEANIEFIETRLADLEAMVSGDMSESGLNIKTVTHANLINDLTKSIAELKTSAGNIRADLNRVGMEHVRTKTRKDMINQIGLWLGWVVTSAIALYAALRPGGG